MTRKLSTKTGTENDYKQFLNNVEIYALGLDSISAEIKREAYAIATADKAAEVIREIKSHFKLIEVGEEFFDVRAAFTVRVKQQNEELLLIRASFTAHFHIKKGMPVEKHASKFAQLEARLIFWPYFRQIVADTTARMHIRPLIIPLTVRP